MSTQQRTRMLDDLMQKVASLKEQKNRLDDQANEFAEKRNRLNEKVRDLRTEINELRNERDQTNTKVKELKEQRNRTTGKIKEKIGEIKRLEEERRDLAKKKPSRSHKALQEEVEGLDWKIQTTPLTLQEDKELVEKVKQLETQLNVHRKLERLSKKVSNLTSEVKNLKVESERCHNELTTHAKKSQDIQVKMLAKIKESKEIKLEADALHKQFLTEKEIAKPLQDEMTTIFEKIKQLKDDIRREEEKQRKESEDQLRQTLETRAMEKLKRGEKLSWEEFQLLGEKGMTAQD